MLAIAIAAGLGGGILRDLLLNLPPVALTNPRYLPTVVVAGPIGTSRDSPTGAPRLLSPSALSV